ncbi:MAG TPA: hypothetical protein VMR44_06745 [Thermoanaerobaculia bacterium]|nr:hypothetical protein [Thermoanaerobaculia bacterium]
MPTSPTTDPVGRRPPAPHLPVSLALVGAGPEARDWLAALEAAGVAVRATECEDASGFAAALRDPLDLVLVWDDAAGERALSVLAVAEQEGSEVAVAVVVHAEAAAGARAAQGEGAAALLARSSAELLPETLRWILSGARLETRSELAGRIAHDLNNRLAPIPLVLNLLRRSAGRPLDPGQLDAVELATRGSMAAVRELSELLAAPPEAPVRIGAKHLLALAARSWRRPLAATVGASTSVIADYPPDLAAVRVDPIRLLQVLWCLARRALDGAAGGDLQFRGRNLQATLGRDAAALGPAVELRVVCGGSAVEVGEGPEPSPWRSAPYDLAGVRAVVEAHGGSLRALAAAPDGCGYAIVLPVPVGASRPTGSSRSSRSSAR